MTFLAYDPWHTHRIYAYTQAPTKRAAAANFRRRLRGVKFGGRFGIQTMPISDWTESEIERAGGYAIPRTAAIQTAIDALPEEVTP